MSLRFNVRTNIRDNLPRDAPARINAGMRGAISRSTRVGRNLTRSLTPRRRPFTYKTVRSALVGGGPHVEGHFGSDYNVFKYLEEGTPPHIIRARNGGYLRFVTGGQVVFARSVNHPGTKAQGMLDRAGPASGQVAKAELAGVFARVFGV